MSPVKERRAREKRELRGKILDAARDLFVREGYENVSMRRVAEMIEYSPTTIYLYFKDKFELLFSLCEETFTLLVKELEALQLECADPVVCLRRGLRTYVEFGLKSPNHYRVTFLRDHSHRGECDRYPMSSSMGIRAFEILSTLVGEAVRQGKFRPVDVAATSQALWAAVHGLTSLFITHPDFPWAERDQLIGHLIDTMLTGLKR